jgi:hypothetical protein
MMGMNRQRGKSAATWIILCSITAAMWLINIMGAKASEEWDDWDSQLKNDYEAKALAVNEGDLEFLAELPDKPLPVLRNQLTISRQSLKDGWIDMVQCHSQLDSVALAQVLYHPQRTRNIRILSSKNIKHVWVEDNSVQMEDISANASLCVQAQVKALYSNFNGSYSMRNGPFLRKFLDGYYPMQVTMDVTFPESRLSFEAITPQQQSGFNVHHEHNSMNIEAWFVGELEIEIYFTDLTAASEEGGNAG